MGQVLHGSATTTEASVERYSIVMSGRRPRIKGFQRGVMLAGAVMSSAFDAGACPAGPDGIRWSAGLIKRTSFML